MARKTGSGASTEYYFNIHNTTSALLKLSLYDWNDSGWGISYSDTKLQGKETKEVFATHNNVMQFGLWRQNGEKCDPMAKIFMNQYSTVRDWNIIQNDDGTWDIVKADPSA